MPRLARLIGRPLALAALTALIGAGRAPAPRLQETQSAATLAPPARPLGRLQGTERHIPAARAAMALAVGGAAGGELSTRRWTPAAVRARLAAGAGESYIGELLAAHDSSLARWPARAGEPLRVWVQPASTIPTWRPVFVDRVRSAFGDWEALGIPLRFVFVADSGAADVHVTWIDRFDEPISGKTVWARNDNWWIVSGDITIAVHHSRGAPLDASAVKAIALHEIGHLLGLDHTADPANIMAARVRVRDLSAADRATMRLLYELPPGRVE